MDVIEFLKQVSRICKASKCSDCPIKNEQEMCRVIVNGDPEIAVDIVEKWAKEHTIKTRQSEFLKQWPNAKLYDGVLMLCPVWLNGNMEDSCDARKCFSCRREFWLQEVN